MNTHSDVDDKCCRYLQYLNVVLHGLWVIDIGCDSIELLTPFVEEHKYRAGNWKKDELETLCDGELYALVGVKQFIEPPALCSEFNVIFSKSRHNYSVDRSKSYVCVRLPFPKAIKALRCQEGRHCYAGRTPVIANGVSLLQVLIYPVADFDDVRLWGSEWEPYIWEEGDYKVANLHLWAEPEKKVDEDHSMHAYGRLIELMPPLDVQLITDAHPDPDNATGVIGLPAEQEQSLQEWLNPGGEGSRTSNCQAIISTI